MGGPKAEIGDSAPHLHGRRTHACRRGLNIYFRQPTALGFWTAGTARADGQSTESLGPGLSARRRRRWTKATGSSIAAGRSRRSEFHLLDTPSMVRFAPFSGTSALLGRRARDIWAHCPRRSSSRSGLRQDGLPHHQSLRARSGPHCQGVRRITSCLRHGLSRPRRNFPVNRKARLGIPPARGSSARSKA